MPSQEEANEAYKTGIALGLIKPPEPPDTTKLAELQKRLNDLEAERLLCAARCSAAPSDPKLVIGGRVVAGEEVLQAFKEMPKSDRQSLLEDLRLLDAMEAEAQQNDKADR